MSMMTATIQNTFHHHRLLATSTGDLSYSSSSMDRSWRAGSYARKPSAVAPWASATTGDGEDHTSHFRPRSNGTRDAYPSVSPWPTPSSPSPRVAYTSPSSASPAPSLRASMTFCNTTATSMWAVSPDARSSSSSCSSPLLPLAERESYELCSTHAGKVESERDDQEWSARREPLTTAQRGTLKSPLRPSQTIRAQRRSPDNRPEAPTSQGRLQPVLSSERHTYKERKQSWSPESARHPYLPTSPLRAAYRDFVEETSRPDVSDSSAHPADTMSPPPSPSPSTSSFGTNAHSSGRTDTDPTDEDDCVKCEYDSVELPPLRFSRPNASESTQPLRRLSDLDCRAPVSLVHRDARNPVQRPIFTSSTSLDPRASPEAPFRHGARIHTPPVQASNVRTHVVHRNDKVPLPHSMSVQLKRSSRRDPTPPRERFGQDADPALLAPTALKKFRFVSSQLLGVGGREEGLEIERGRPIATASPTGTKRRHASASSPSSVDVPLSVHHDEEDGPRKRGRDHHHQQSFGVTSFVAVGSNAPGARGPRGAIVPAYHYDTERALTCAFPSCGSVLTGKKSETASHMRAHFMQAAGQTLHCPWPVEMEDGQRVRCGMPFKDSANFGRHVSSKHIKAEEYQCNRCARPFARRDAALRHMKTLCRDDGPSRRRKEKATRNKAEEMRHEYLFE